MLQTCTQCKNSAGFDAFKKRNSLSLLASLCSNCLVVLPSLKSKTNLWTSQIKSKYRSCTLPFYSLRIGSFKGALPLTITVPAPHPFRQGTHLSNCLQMKQYTRPEAREQEVMLRLENQDGDKGNALSTATMPSEPDQRLQLKQREKCWF